MEQCACAVTDTPRTWEKRKDQHLQNSKHEVLVARREVSDQKKKTVNPDV